MYIVVEGLKLTYLRYYGPFEEHAEAIICGRKLSKDNRQAAWWIARLQDIDEVGLAGKKANGAS